MMSAGILSTTAFVTRYGPLFEACPWVAERAAARQPFADAQALHAALMAVVDEAPTHERLTLIRGFPEPAPPRAGHNLSAQAMAELAAAGFDRLEEDEAQLFRRLNAIYRARFGFPFVICLAENGRAAILAAMDQRLTHEREAEVAVAIGEIDRITRLRLDGLAG